MPKRICPRCQITLGEHDSHFCAACGETLPKDLITAGSSIRVRTYSPAEPEVKEGPVLGRILSVFSNKTLWSILGLFVFIFLVFVGIASSGAFELLGVKLDLPNPISKINLPSFSAAPKFQNLPLSLTLPEISFDSTKLAVHVPSDVDFYFEGNSLRDVLELSLFSEMSEDIITRSRLLLKPNFAGFVYADGDENIITFIVYPKDVPLVGEVFAEFETDHRKFAIIGDYMLITNNDSVFDLVKSVDDGIKRSLAQNPEYVTRERNLSAIGQFRVFFMSGDAKSIVRNSLGGLTQETIGMINKVLTSDFDSLVITNTNGQE